MIRKEKDGLVWFEFEILQQFPFIRHGCFTRKGGPLGSLNVSEQENRACIEKILSSSLTNLNQVHGTRILPLPIPDPKTPCDGVITDQKGRGLMIKHADCQACLFLDPKRRVIGAAHAGWRGSVQNIYKETVLSLQTQYGSQPEDLIACIGPSLSPSKSEFINWEKELPPSFSRFQTGVHFDFWAITCHQLEECGLLPEHIEVSRLCTFSAPDLFFSFRRSNRGLKRNNATCITLV